MKINKLATGATVNFHTVGNPIMAQQSETVQEPVGKSKKQELVSDSLMKELYSKGIPVDVDNISEEISDLQEREAMGFSVTAREINRLNAKINRIAQQATYLENAEQQAVKNESLGEVAVSDRGELFIQTKDGVKKVSMSEFNLEEDGPALTVNELIMNRKFNPNMAFDISLTQTIGTSVGLPKIQEYLQKVISMVGDSETSSEAYTTLASIVGREAAKKPSEEQLRSLQALKQLGEKVGFDAIFKEKDTLKSDNLKAGLEYLQKILPRNMKYQLMAQHVSAGGKYESGVDYMEEVLLNALTASNDTKVSHSVDFDAAATKFASGAGASGKTFYQTPNEALFDGDLNQTDIFLSDPRSKNSFGISLKGNVAPVLTTDNGNAVTNGSMDMVLNATVGKYLNYNKIYMGEQKLYGAAQLGNIAYGNDPVAQVYMPVLADGSIDWSGFHAYSLAEEQIKASGVTDPKQKNEIHAAMGSYVQYDDRGNIIQTDKVQPYLMTYGYTIDDNIDSSNSLAEELYGKSEDAADQLLGLIYNKNMAKKGGYKKMPGKQVWDDIYKVPIFIQVNQFAAQDAYRYAGHGSLMTPKTLEEDMVQQRVTAEPAMQVYGNSALLYQE